MLISISSVVLFCIMIEINWKFDKQHILSNVNVCLLLTDMLDDKLANVIDATLPPFLS